MYALLIIIHIIVSVVLVVTVLLQAGKGGGLSALGGGGGGGLQTAFGAEAGDVMKKATSVTAVVFMVTSLSLAFISAQRGSSVIEAVAPEQTPDSQPVQQQQARSAPVVTKKVVKIDPETGKQVEVEEEVESESALGSKVKGMIEKFGEATAQKEQQKTETPGQKAETVTQETSSQPIETTPSL